MTMNDVPVCPVCGEECSIIYISSQNSYDIAGCDKCLLPEDADEWNEDRKANERDLWEEFKGEGER